MKAVPKHHPLAKLTDVVHWVVGQVKVSVNVMFQLSISLTAMETLSRCLDMQHLT